MAIGITNAGARATPIGRAAGTARRGYGRRLGLAMAGLAALLTGCPLPWHKKPQQPLPPVVLSQPPMVINPPTVTEPVPEPPTTTAAGTSTPAPRNKSTVVINNEPHGRQPARRTPAAPPAARPPVVTADATKKPATPASPPGSSPQLTLGNNPEQLQHDRQETVQYLNSARSDLRELQGRRLNGEQANNAAQANEYVRQAQLALDQGDVLRARNLAVKASVLTRALLANP